MQESYRYWAFISYSHHDRRWARWLHRRLEGYRVPRRLLGGGEGGLPRRLYPVFRDRDELPSSADLGGVVQRALIESRYLIVICSRRSATSRWVNEEVEAFKRLGREDRVLCLKIGDASGAECFAPALLRHYDADGRPSGRATEPLAADMAVAADGRGGAVLKLIAGMIGVGYDDLRRRDRRRQLLQRVFASVAVVVLLAALVMSWRWQQAERRAALDAQALQARVHQLYSSGRNELLAHNETRAAVLLNEAYRLGIDTPALHFMLGRAMRVVDAQMTRIDTGAPVAVADISADGRDVFSIDDRYRLRVYDRASRRQRFAVSLGKMDSYWASYSPAGTLIWVDSDHAEAPRRRLRLYDAETGTLRAQYAMRSNDTGVAMPPVSDDDRRVAFVAPDRSIALAMPGQPARRIAGEYSAAGFCRGRDVLLAARSDGTIERRDAASGVLLGHYEGLQGVPTMLASSQACGLVAAGSTSGAVRVWNASRGTVLMSGGHTQPVIDLRLNDDGSRLMSLTRSAVGIWNGISGGLIYASRFLDPVGNLAMLRPDGRQLAQLADGRLSVLDPRAGLELYSLDGHNGSPSVFAFDRTNRHLLSGGGDGDLLVWALPESERAEFASSVPEAGGAPLAFSPDGRQLFVAAREGGGALWRREPLQREHVIAAGRDTLAAVAFDPEGRQLATATDDGALQITDVASGDARALGDDGARVRLLAFDASGRYLGVSLIEGYFVLHDLQQPAAVPTRFERDQVRAYGFAPHEELLALGAHGQIRLWDLRRHTWRWQRPLPKTDGGGDVGVIAFSPDGRRLLVTDKREHAYLLDADDGRVIDGIDVPASALFNVADFSRDGRQIVLGDWAKCAWLWRLADHRVLSLSGHTAPVRTASFDDDGALVLTAGEDGVIKTWDADSGELLDSFGAHDGAIQWNHARFSPDGREILSSGSDGYTRLWPVTSESREESEIAAILRCRAPWRLDGTLMVPRQIDAVACAVDPSR